MDTEFVKLLIAQFPVVFILLYIMRQQEIRINVLLGKLIDKGCGYKKDDEVN